MRKRNRWVVAFLLLTAFLLSVQVYAQLELAAVLRVTTAGVEVQRVNTSALIPVEVESIVGVGDTISTNAQGAATITFMDGMTTDLMPNTQYRIEQFEGTSSIFFLTVEVLRGRTIQRIGNELNRNSSYRVRTPGMTLGARGTTFEIRVEATGRTGVIVEEGAIEADKLGTMASVPAGFGVRAPLRGDLSDVVRADTFDQLDSAIDGCAVLVQTPDDVSTNLRLGPSVEQARVGGIAAQTINIALGVSESGNWYRIAYRGGFAWFLSTSLEVVGACAGLRVFPDDHAEDPEAFTEPLGFMPELPGLATPEPETTPEPDADDAPNTVVTPETDT